MFKYPQSGHPPPPFYPSSQQQQQHGQSRAVPIVAPNFEQSLNDGSNTRSMGTPELGRASLASSSTRSSSSPFFKPRSAVGQSSASSEASPSSPLKGALSARAASAAVFVPKNAASGEQSGGTEMSGSGEVDSSASQMMQGMNLGDSQGGGGSTFNPYVNIATSAGATDSGRGTPNSFGMGGYEIDGSNSMFDPTYMGSMGQGQEAPSSHGTPAASAGGAAQTASRGSGKAFNPYEHMNEYGEPAAVSGNSLSMGGSGQGLDYYSSSGRGSTGTSAPPSNKLRQPLQYHLYHPPLPHVSNLHPQHLSAHAFFMSPELREDLQRKNEAVFTDVPPPELGGPNLPEELHVYHSLVPLEHSTTSSIPGSGLIPQLIDPRITPLSAPGTATHLTGGIGEPSKVFGYRTHVYKAICNLDGKAYTLRRLENFRLNHEAAIGLVEKWRRIRHPSVVSVREAFTTRAFGDQSIVFVYDYHPLATTLYGEHMVPKPPQPDRRTGRLQPVHMQIHEKTLWSYACQLANAIRCIHHQNMATRCIEPSKVLRTGKNRIRINCCSIFDVIAYDPNANFQVRQAQQGEDLINLGKLLVSLSCNSMSAVQNMQKSIEQISRTYSSEYKNIILWLLAKPSGTKTADELVKLLATRMADEVDSALNFNDSLESHLTKELENARLVRLLCKFGFINERPEFDHDPRWSETGDRYIIKLFRDYVFHSIDEAGRPVVDLSHILTNLNKLDAGSEEKIVLTSRDEQSCLVVSFREIKNCIESAFQDLSRAQ